MKIVDITAYPISFTVPPERRVTLGIGTATKRDCVIVKVTTEDGIVGWGESHAGRAPGAIGRARGPPPRRDRDRAPHSSTALPEQTR